MIFPNISGKYIPKSLLKISIPLVKSRHYAYNYKFQPHLIYQLKYRAAKYSSSASNSYGVDVHIHRQIYNGKVFSDQSTNKFNINQTTI